MMLRATLKGLLTRKLRLVLSGLAVVFGVMAVSGALIVTDTLGSAFTTLFQTVNADLDVQVTGSRNVDAQQGPAYSTPVPAALADTVAAVSGVASATGDVLTDGAKVIGSDGKVVASGGSPSFGTAWHGEDDLVTLRSGRGPQAPDEVAVNAGLAAQAGFGVGGPIQILVHGHRRAFTLVGIFGYSGGRDSLAGESRVAFTLPVAQEIMLGQPGLFSAINIRAVDGVPAGRLRDTVQAAVGDKYTVRTGKQVADEQAAATNGFIGIFRNFLLGFAAVTLFVGVFLILNTFSILVAQRTRELALMRAIGASRRQVIGSVLVEAVVVGIIASTLGLAAGLGIAVLLKTLLQARTGVSLPAAGLSIPPSAIIAGYTVGVAVTLVAALMPALRAAQVPPVAAMREAGARDRPLTRLTAGGALITVAGTAAVGFALFAGLGNATAPALLGGVRHCRRPDDRHRPRHRGERAGRLPQGEYPTAGWAEPRRADRHHRGLPRPHHTYLRPRGDRHRQANARGPAGRRRLPRRRTNRHRHHPGDGRRRCRHRRDLQARDHRRPTADAAPG